MTSTPSKNENFYYVDVDNSVERQRLARQGRLLQQGLHGHLPEALHDPKGKIILDLACGDGAWALDVARTYPEAQVIGVDLSRTAVELGREKAQAEGIQNVTFRIMDVLKPFEFETSSIDLVNARSVFQVLPLTAWPTFIQECLRIVRPEGMFRLTEGEFGLSNGPATEKLASLRESTMHHDGKSFSPDGRHTGITPMLWLFLRNAGFEHIQQKAYAIEYLGERDAQGDLYHNLIALYKLLGPIIAKTGMVTQEEYNTLYKQFIAEMESKDFCQVWYYLTVWGQKPLEA